MRSSGPSENVGELHSQNCTCACSYRAVEPGATAPGNRTRTVPRFRSRESFSLALGLDFQHARVSRAEAAAAFYTHITVIVIRDVSE